MDRERRSARHSAEFVGRTVEEALETASGELGIPIAELEYQVLSDSSRSFLGLVRTGEVRIRVSWEAQEAQPSKGQEDEAQEPQAALADRAPAVEDEQPPLGAAEPEEYEEEAPSYKQNPPELQEVALDVLTTLLDKIGVLAAVEVVDRGGKLDEVSGEVSPLVLNVVGDDLGALIGRRGETLRDLQFMTRLITSRRIGVWPNLVVDVEGYKTRREESLRALARRVADQVRSSGQPMALEPMPAYERRIIHLALRDDPDVYTESTGKDEHRKVQILPR